jgi:hypothetical protein
LALTTHPPVQKLSGDAAIALRPADCVFRSQALFENLRTRCSTNPLQSFTIANQGNQGRAQDTAKITTRRKSSEWSAFWKNLLRRYYRVRRLPDNVTRFSFKARDPSQTTLGISAAGSRYAHTRKTPQSGAGEGNRTPDPLITNQMLYRLSYASNWGKARLRASLSHGSLPDVRDNYLRYHKENKGRNIGPCLGMTGRPF